MEKWLQQFKETLLNEFGESIQFIGIQGSRARNEATENSDYGNSCEKVCPFNSWKHLSHGITQLHTC